MYSFLLLATWFKNTILLNNQDHKTDVFKNLFEGVYWAYEPINSVLFIYFWFFTYAYVLVGTERTV